MTNEEVQYGRRNRETGAIHALDGTPQITDDMVERARQESNRHDFAGHGKCHCGWPQGRLTTSIGHGQHRMRAALEAALGGAE